MIKADRQKEQFVSRTLPVLVASLRQLIIQKFAPKQVDIVIFKLILIVTMQIVYDVYFFFLCVFAEKYPYLNLFFSFFRLSAQSVKISH